MTLVEQAAFSTLAATREVARDSDAQPTVPTLGGAKPGGGGSPHWEGEAQISPDDVNVGELELMSGSE